MNIYYGKNRMKAKKITLKALIEKAINIDDDKITAQAGRLDDNSDSYIEFQKETMKMRRFKNGEAGVRGGGARLDIYLSFDPETDFEIRDVDIFISERLEGYDEENMIKI
jgi:hypothetical protein